MKTKIFWPFASILAIATPLATVIACGNESDYDWADINLDSAEGNAFIDALKNTNLWSDVTKTKIGYKENSETDFSIRYQIEGKDLQSNNQVLIIEVSIKGEDNETFDGTIGYQINNNSWVRYTIEEIINSTTSLDSLFYNSLVVISNSSDLFAQALDGLSA